MSDGIFSISVSTSTLEETTTSLVKTATINTTNVSSDETLGASSYDSTSSASSSAENISTVENGDMSVFTFITSGRRTSSNLECNSSCSKFPCSHSSATCGCRCGGDSPNRHRMTSHQSLYENLEHDSGSVSFSINPFRLDGSHMYSYKTKHQCHNHILSDNYVKLLQRVADGVLLRSLEKGVLFPVIHWTSKFTENLTHSHRTYAGHNLVFNQGIYKELKRVIPPDVWLQKESSFSSTKRPTWLVLGYKSLEKTLDSALEATWKEWTGVRHIYLNLRHDFEIRRISFYNRVHPIDNLELFMYLVLMEIGSVDAGNLIWLLDFVQRTRVERMKGFLTVYTEADPGISSIDEDYLKYLSVSSNDSSKSSRKSPFPTAASSYSSSSSAEGLTIVDTSHELNENLKFIEKLLEEIHDPPINDYF